MLQTKAVGLITLSSVDAHSSPLFKKLSILKMNDLVEYYVAIFMFKYNNNLLPPVFKNFFISVSNIHKYQTGSATKENFYILKVKTNCGKFNIRFQGAKTWNAIEESLRKVGSLKKFKYNLKSTVIKSLVILVTPVLFTTISVIIIIIMMMMMMIMIIIIIIIINISFIHVKYCSGVYSTSNVVLPFLLFIKYRHPEQNYLL